MTDIEDRLTSIETLLGQILEKFDNPSSTRSSKKKTVAPKVEQFKISTQDLIDTSQPLCAYMQRSDDCEGHCGRPAIYSVIRDKPIEIDDLDLAEAKDENQKNIRKAFNRCPGCKAKAKTKENSRGYKEIKKFIYKQTGDDTAVSESISEMMGSPKNKSKAKPKAKAKKTSDSDDEANIEDGLDDPNPDDPNSNLLKTDKWYDTFVKVGKKNVIIRKYNDKRKKDVCLGLIDEEPEDDQYEENLRKPGKSLIDTLGIKYKTPEEATRETPPKAKKDDDDEEVEKEEKGKKVKAKKEKESSKSKKVEDSDEDDPPPPPPKGKKGKKGKEGKEPEKKDSDDDGSDDNEAEAFREIADSD